MRALNYQSKKREERDLIYFAYFGGTREKAAEFGKMSVDTFTATAFGFTVAFGSGESFGVHDLLSTHLAEFYMKVGKRRRRTRRDWDTCSGTSSHEASREA